MITLALVKFLAVMMAVAAFMVALVDGIIGPEHVIPMMVLVYLVALDLRGDFVNGYYPVRRK